MSRIDKLVRQAVEEGFYQQTKDQEAISRVRELHDGETGDCQECSKFESGITVPFPCPTIKALDGVNE